MLRALWAGVVISLAAFSWALVLRYAAGRDLIGPDRAAGASLLLAAYPFALFYSAPYTESLFLLGAVGAFYHFRRGRVVGRVVLGPARRPHPPEWMPPQHAACHPGARAVLRLARSCARTAVPGDGVDASGSVGSPADRRHARHRHAALHRRISTASPASGSRGRAATKPGAGRIRAWAIRHRVRMAARRAFLQVVTNIPYNTLNALGVLFGLALIYRSSAGSAPPSASSCSINLVPPLFAGGVLSMGRLTSTLFPLFLALAARRPAADLPAWVAGVRDRAGPVRRAVLHLARAVLNDWIAYSND